MPTEYGGECQPGEFCVGGNAAPEPCTAGKHCNATGLSAPSGNCSPGYYCPAGSSSPEEIECPVGRYCPEENALPIPCSNGTYNPAMGQDGVEDCLPCEGGFYCNEIGASTTSGECAEGYYCPPGQSTPTPGDYPCPAGHYCMDNFADPERCEDGYYQDEEGKVSCLPCEEGYFCDNTVVPVVHLNGSDCPAGYYCLPMTKRANEYPCPPGTFNNLTNAFNESWCQPCLARYYCLSAGLNEPEALCYGGFYCEGGDAIPNPNICPAGSYCPEGSYQPTPCPAGTISSGLGNINETSCAPCDIGRYCNANSSQNGVTPPCSAGYVCTGGSDTPTPADGVKGYECPVGHYCEEGAPSEIPCNKGKYAPYPRMGECDPCPESKTCPEFGMNTTLPCPTGFYCQEGTDDDGEPCPPGTFSDKISLINEEDCQACLIGMYCETPGLSWPTGECDAGFLCLEGAATASPNDGMNEPCQVGHYCENGTHSATPCPPGTMNQNRGGVSVDDCVPCEAGHYCEGTGLSQPSGVCSERYYCPSNAVIDSAEPVGYECPAGFYCLNQTATPTACDPGTYQPYVAEVDCNMCPEGFFCMVNSSTPEPCSAYSYCPQGSIEPTPCPNGTYTMDNVIGLIKPSQCQECPTGSYCVGGRIAGPCTAGFLCYSGSNTPTPDGSDIVMGEPCPIGYYCLEGALNVSVCSPGQVITEPGAKSSAECTQCPAGYICTVDSIKAEPCTPGYFCEFNEDPKPCPNTTFSDESKATNSSTCQPCPAGYWCNVPAMTDFSISPCPLGYYCPEATPEPLSCPPGTYRDTEAAESQEDCLLCPAGYYCPNDTANTYGIECLDGQFCPAGSWDQRDCQPGYYCNRSMTQEACPSGFYCPVNSSYPVPCPAGHYCGESCETEPCPGAIMPIKCPLGYREKDGSRRSTFKNTCQICAAGYYGNEPDRANCTICRAGVVCLEGATTDEPQGNDTQNGVNVTNSYPCPIGYYCPEGSYVPLACNVGLYNEYEYGMSEANCLNCPVDHFNHLQGQGACFHCGAEAFQTEMGQPQCQCAGAGKQFQASDRKCLCKQGYITLVGREQDCVEEVYDICTEGTSRSQNGTCLDSTGWENYCRDGGGCPTAEDYLGYDQTLSLCKCKVDDLQEICDLECRLAQRNRMTLVCEDPPYVCIEYTTGEQTKIPVSSLTKVINARNAISADQCGALDGTAQVLHVTEMSANGFLGVYDPSPEQLETVVMDNAKGLTNGTSANGTTTFGVSRRRLLSVDNSTVRRRGRRLLSSSGVDGSSFSGISDPAVCLKYGETMMFYVDNDNYPVYNRENLYNTNEQFDYGGFRELEEMQTQIGTSTTLFTYRFVDPGVYVFCLSSNSERKMYIRVMAKNAQCSEDGPFFPATPRYIVQNGIALGQSILLAADWVTIGLLLGMILIFTILLVLVLILFRKYGWGKVSYTRPKYRNLIQNHNFDDYASKGSAVHPVKKYNRAIEGRGEGVGGAVVIDEAVEVKGDEYWDYDKQVDFEAFSTADFYGHLSQQSRHVTSELGRQKEEAKALYRKLCNQAENLKGLWVAKMNLKGRSALATDEDLEAYERKSEELEMELERRKELGYRFETILKRQLEIKEQDEKSREDHQVSYLSALREAVRMLNEYTEGKTNGKKSLEQEFDNTTQKHVIRRVGALLGRMSSEVSAEAQRIGAWGVLGQGIGAQLVAPGSDNTPVDREELFGPDGSVQRTDLIHQNTTTGLIVPNSDARMLSADGHVRNIPPDYFVHPLTGRVLPVQGNVSYDPTSSRLIHTVDSSVGDLVRSDEPLIPYIPFPTDPNNGLPVDSKLTTIERTGDLKLNAPMSDPDTGLKCPIVAMTIHPQSGVAYPVAGTHTDPVTGLPVPIEIGAVMIDPSSEQPVPVLSVAIDPETGDVIPVGGTLQTPNGTHNAYITMVTGDRFIEPLSNLQVLTQSAALHDNEALPSSGGYQTLLDANLMACQVKILEVVKAYLDAAVGPEGLNCRHEQSQLETVMKELIKARQRCRGNHIRAIHNVQRRLERASILAVSGGSPGMYEHTATGQILPILVGTHMADPGGSGQDVTILGVERNSKTGSLIPLGGTMEDPDGDGLIPIMVGLQAVDEVTGDLSPITGVRINPETETVVPVTVSADKKKKPPLGAVAMLEDEIVARRGYWRRQRQREEGLTTQESKLVNQLLLDIENVDVKKVEEDLDSFSDMAKSLEDTNKREVTRRVEATEELNNVLTLHTMSILTQGDDTERLYEERHHASHRKFVDTVRKIYTRLQAEESKYKERLAELEDALNPDAESAVMQRYRQAKSRLQAELKDQLLTRTENLDEDHSALEYARERSELLSLEAKAVLSNAIILAGDYDATMTGVYGDSNVTEQSSREIIPLLRQIIAMLEKGAHFTLSAELLQGIAGDGGGDKKYAKVNAMGPGTINRNIVQGDQYNVNIAQKDTLQLLVPQQPGGVSIVQPVRAAAALPDRSQAALQASSRDIRSNLVVRNNLVSLTDDDKHAMSKSMAERQTIEAIKLESSLREGEIKEVNAVVQSFEAKKESTLKEKQADLKKKLAKAESDDEKAKIMQEFVDNAARVSQEIESSKQAQLKSLQRQLAAKRTRAKKDLHNQHIDEAKREGLGEDVVPDILFQDEEEVNKEMQLLMLMQQQLMADLQKGYAEADEEFMAKKRNGLDAEMEEKMRLLNLASRGPKITAVVDAISQTTRDINRGNNNLKNKMKDRLNKRRNSRKSITPDGIEPGTDEEKQYVQTAESQMVADHERSIQAAMEIANTLANDEQKEEHEKAIKELLTDEEDKTEAEKNAILEQYLKEVDSAQEKLKSSRDEQKEHLLAKLAARKRLKEEVMAENAVAKELDHITKKQVLKGTEEGALAIDTVNSNVTADESLEQKEKLLSEQEERQAKLDIAQQSEVTKLNKTLDSELTVATASIDEQLEDQKKQLLRRQEREFEKDMQVKRKQLSEDQSKELMEEHKKNMDKLSQSMDVEKDRQKATLAERIAEKRLQNQERIKQKHNVEMTQEMLAQKIERDELSNKQLKGAERPALVQSLEGEEIGKAENIIYRVLRQRHMKEQVQQEEQMDREKEAAIIQAQAKMAELCQKERDTLMEAQQKEFLELIANSGSLSAANLAEKKEKLQQQHQKQLVEFDKIKDQRMEQASKDCLPGIEVKQAHARLAMRERQLRELAEAMRDLSPEEALVHQYTEAADKAALDAQKFRESKMSQMTSEIQRIKAEKQKRDDERRRRMQQELDSIESELEIDRVRDEQRQQERDEQRSKTIEEQKQEKERRLQQEMKQLEGNKDAQEKLLAEHEENMKRFEDSQIQEQKRNKEKTRARLEARRKKKEGLEKERIKADINTQAEVDDRRTQDHLNNIQRQGASELNQTINSTTAPDAPGDWAQREQEAVDRSKLPPGMDDSIFNALLASPLYKDLQEIEEIVNSTDALKRPGVKGAVSDAFIDVKDAQWLLAQDIVPLDINSITPSQFVIYRFGVFIVRLLKETIGTPNVTLLLASSLPQNDYDHNMYRRSFFYQRAMNILFIRQERLESVGEFVMLIMHCLAHIKTGELKDDSDPLFLRAFYKAMKVICQDMFFARSRSSPLSVALIGSTPSSGKTALEHAFKYSKTDMDKTGVVGELVNVKVKVPVEQDFNEETIKERLENAQDKHDNSRLRDFLQSRGGAITTKDFVASRLRELKGMTTAEEKSTDPVPRAPKPILSGQVDFLTAQIRARESQLDNLNAQLGQALAEKQTIQEGLAQPEDSVGEGVAVLKGQLSSLGLKTENLMKKIAQVEEEVAKKRKDRQNIQQNKK